MSVFGPFLGTTERQQDSGRCMEEKARKGACSRLYTPPDVKVEAGATPALTGEGSASRGSSLVSQVTCWIYTAASESGQWCGRELCPPPGPWKP